MVAQRSPHKTRGKRYQTGISCLRRGLTLTRLVGWSRSPKIEANEDSEANMAKKKRHYSLYVIRLDPKVLEVPKFVAANADHDEKKPCVYVGMTWHTPVYNSESIYWGLRRANWPRSSGWG